MDPAGSVGSQDFRLTWVNYSQKLTESFHKFLTSEILCNVTLWVHEGSGSTNSIKAHQAILSACSPWFEKILSANQHPHPIIILKDVKYHDLKNIIRFIYTGEVFVPQHDLNDFLRTAELLEIKGLLKDDAAWPPTGLASLFQGAPMSPTPSSSNHKTTSLPNLPTVPVSSFLLPSGNTASIVSSGQITESSQIQDLVSQIKVPVSLPSQPVSKTALSANNATGTGSGLMQTTHVVHDFIPGGSVKRRKVELAGPRGSGSGSGLTLSSNNVNASKTHHVQVQQLQPQSRPRLVNASATTTQIVVEDPVSLKAHHESSGAGPMMSSTVEEDGVSWIEETTTSNCTPLDSSSALTPAEWVATGINDCGAFKRLWAERYLCYNLGREIICLLCFCRFTQFKKFNLERHMKNKHPQMYGLNESSRRQILERFVARYIDHVTPSTGAGSVNGPSTSGSASEHRSHDVASEILAIGPIQIDDLTLDPGEEEDGGGGDISKIKEEGSTTGSEQNNRTGNSSKEPPENIMVELEDQDSEMLLVK